MASAAASSNYNASAAGAASNYAATNIFNNNKAPKFTDYRSRVCQLFLYFYSEKQQYLI
jgi:hypothetical protein